MQIRTIFQVGFKKGRSNLKKEEKKKKQLAWALHRAAHKKAAEQRGGSLFLFLFRVDTTEDPPPFSRVW